MATLSAIRDRCCQRVSCPRPRVHNAARPHRAVLHHVSYRSHLMPDIDPRLAQHIARTIATEIGAQPAQANAAIALLDEGATVPFIARYRKEVTGGLDDSQLRTLETRLTYLRELEERRAAVLTSIQEQGKLTDELRKDIEGADSKARLEDLYLPYKPKRRTRAQIAREAGLE